MLKFADLKTLSHAATVRSLYADLPHLSKSDGMRFATKERLREHLDWLFQKNRSKRARERGLIVGGSSRCWFDPIKKIFGEENGKGSDGEEKDGALAVGKDAEVKSEETKLSNAIMAKGASEKCEACREEIDSFWSDEQQAWMLKDAIRTDDDEVYHRTCVESVSTPKYDDGDRESGDLRKAEAKAEAEVRPEKREAKLYSKGGENAVKAEGVATGTGTTRGGDVRSRKRGRDEEQQIAGALYGNEGLSADDGPSPVKKAKLEGSLVQ